MLNVLIVDDIEEVRNHIIETLMLSFKEINCTESHSGSHAEKLILASNPFDLIISDINMPGGDGHYLYEMVVRTNQPSFFIFFSSQYGRNGNFSNSKFLGTVNKLEIDVLVSRIKNAFEKLTPN